jgi:molecular chaperone HtpG
MTSQTHNFEADTGKILDIVINSLYSQKEIFLRELISNASDALNKRKYESNLDKNLISSGESEIILKPDAKNKTLTITDNGIGLNEEDMIEALGTIARSGTKAFLESLQNGKDKSKNKNEMNLIGQFGVGFYSAFMVADRVEVISLKAGTQKAFKWESDGTTGFSISEDHREEAGTTIILHLKKGDKEYSEETRLTHLIKKYSNHVSYPIKIAKKDVEAETINAVEALWTKSPKDISKEDYKSFYNLIGSTFDEPYLIAHNKTEGTIEFTNLLFAPSTQPFDLFDPERKSKIQLYINRVFITDEADDLVPKWLRFLKGVVDTPVLDLNVSREMLQQKPAVIKIKKVIVKKIISELAKKIKKDEDGYDVFWNNFGRVIKEGLYEDHENREKILPLCRFYSLTEEKNISLSTYLERMPEGQNEIYYLSAENLDEAKVSPHLEGFKAKNIDVLILTDPIDDFWIQQLPEYNEKKFVSISRGKVNLDEIKSGKKKAKKGKDKDYKGLIEKIKNSLGEKVADVIISRSLTESPARLVADDNAMDIQMEKMMMIQNPNFKGSPRVMEINIDHDLIKSMNGKVSTSANLLDDLSLLLFDQSRILEGKTPESLNDFNQRLTRVMQLSL